MKPQRIIRVEDLLKHIPALPNWDMPMRMYFDETNNIRRRSLSEVSLNAPADRTFAIAVPHE